MLLTQINNTNGVHLHQKISALDAVSCQNCYMYYDYMKYQYIVYVYPKNLVHQLSLCILCIKNVLTYSFQ